MDNRFFDSYQLFFKIEGFTFFSIWRIIRKDGETRFFDKG